MAAGAALRVARAHGGAGGCAACCRLHRAARQRHAQRQAARALAQGPDGGGEQQPRSAVAGLQGEPAGGAPQLCDARWHALAVQSCNGRSSHSLKQPARLEGCVTWCTGQRAWATSSSSREMSCQLTLVFITRSVPCGARGRSGQIREAAPPVAQCSPPPSSTRLHAAGRVGCQASHAQAAKRHAMVLFHPVAAGQAVRCAHARLPCAALRSRALHADVARACARASERMPAAAARRCMSACASDCVAPRPPECCTPLCRLRRPRALLRRPTRR